jgi:hypothetical protein
MRRVVLLLAGVMLLCLGNFLSLPATTASEVLDVPDVSSALAGANVGHVDRGANAPAPLPDGSYLLPPAEEVQETDKLPVNAYLLTMLVLANASFGASVVLWLLTTNARRQRAIYSLGVVRASLTTACEEPSFLVHDQATFRGMDRCS